jgi:hypothetical protein
VSLKLIAEIAVAVQEVQKLTLTLPQNDPVQDLQKHSTSLMSDIQRVFKLLTTVHESTQDNQKITTSILNSDPVFAVQTIRSTLTDETLAFLKTINSISTSVDGMIGLRNVISADALQELQLLKNTVDERNVVQKLLKLFGTIGSPEDWGSPVQNVQWSIFIDGVSVRRNLKSGSISFSEGSVHNSISLSLAGENVFDLCNPETNNGQSRVEIQINQRALYFLIEERSGSEDSFTIWGRSLTALEDEPYKEKTAFVLGEKRMASDVAQELAGSRALYWECFDWLLPEDFQFVGNPTEGLQLLAHQIGAVVRSQDDGSFLMRSRFPVRPIDLSSVSPEIVCNRDTNMIELTFSENKGSGYNAVPINGKTNTTNAPMISVPAEENTLILGEPATVFVYYGDVDIPVVDVYTTDGTVSKIGTFTETVEEFVVFSEGVSTVAKYIDNLVSYSWEGLSGGNIEWNKNQTMLSISESKYRIAKVIYTTKVQKFIITGHSVEKMQAVFSYFGPNDIAVTVAIGNGDKLAGIEVREYLTSTAAAIAFGTYWLDNQYPKTTTMLRTPYLDLAVDGKTALISNERLRVSGNGKIVSSNISFSGIKVYSELEVDLWTTL